MARIAAGVAALLLFITGVALLMGGDAEASGNRIEDTPAPPPSEEAMWQLPVIPEIAEPPKADPVSKEEKRFNRVDKDRDERITLSEMVHPRRNRFANLDLDGDGVLRFEEWAITTIDKFEGADADSDGILTRAEYATTAPKPRKPKPKCSC